MKITTNSIGEMIVSIRLMEYGLIAVYLLGGNVPAFDILAELIPQNKNEKPYQFLVQVKSTLDTNPYVKKNGNIRTPDPDKKLKNLIGRPLPTYVAGVNLNTEEVYLAPAFNNNISYKSSIPTNTKLEAKSKSKNNEIQLKHLKGGETVIGKRCFIGSNAIIICNVKIVDEVIVGAGAVVTKDVPSNSIVAGNPAKIIRQNIHTGKYGYLIDSSNEKVE